MLIKAVKVILHLKLLIISQPNVLKVNQKKKWMMMLNPMKINNLKQNKSEGIMKNAKAVGLRPSIEAQNAETPRNPNTSGAKISGNQKNINTSGANQGGQARKSPN